MPTLPFALLFTALIAAVYTLAVKRMARPALLWVAACLIPVSVTLLLALSGNPLSPVSIGLAAVVVAPSVLTIHGFAGLLARSGAGVTRTWLGAWVFGVAALYAGYVAVALVAIAGGAEF